MNAPAIGRTPVPGEGFISRTSTYRWDGKPARVPKAGEYYLSGAIPTAYKAQKDMIGEFFIAVPVHETVTPAQLASDIATLATMARTMHPAPRPYQLRAMATRARQLADDADALALHLDTEGLTRLLDRKGA